MSDIRKRLEAKFKEGNRYSNFGPFLSSLNINGFRGINNLDVNFKFPITAISGLNGAGKSTLGQLAVCAYKKPSTSIDYKRQYIKDFFPVSPADPSPISSSAKLLFKYQTDRRGISREVTVTRARSAWSGYKRQPERCCFYIGFTVYIPKVERRDLSIYGGKSLTLTDKREIDKVVQSKLARILGQKYDAVHFQGISHKRKESEIGIASRYGYSYSENNMGFGEGKVLYTVDKLENAPEQSLFVIEEPETSLHESAQYEFAKYLMDVCFRRHHQIILSTHSSVILNALPSQARKLVIRDSYGVRIHNSISASQARSLLSSGHARSLDICVEDSFAKNLLIEAIRLKNRELLKSVSIHEIGDKDAVREATKILRRTGKKAIAVRDADMGEDKDNHIYSLPGNNPPEREVYDTEEVKLFIESKYDVDIGWILEREDIQDHHRITDVIAEEVESQPEVIRSLAIDKYLDVVGDKFDDLVKAIQENA